MTLKNTPPHTFLWDEGSSVCLPPSALLVCCSGFLASSSPSPRCALPQELRASPGLSCPWLKSAPRARNGPRGSRTWDPGPWARPQDGHEGHWGPTAHLCPPISPGTLPTLKAQAVQLLPWGLSTSRAGGRAATLGLCLEPRGSLRLPPPALPEPGPCAACPPCPFVPKADGGGRPTVPEAGHQP